MGLRDEFNTTLPRFDLMAQLERVPDGMKMNALSHEAWIVDAFASLSDRELQQLHERLGQVKQHQNSIDHAEQP